MKALIPDGRGNVRFADVDEAEPAAGAAIVTVEAFSVNRGEAYLLEDPPSGWRPGKDIAGRIALVRAGRASTGRLHPEVGACLPWERTPELVDDLRNRRLRGNAVLTLH